MSLPMATLTCSCGQVTLHLPNPVPKFRCGCCCTECLQRVYIGTNGSPPAALRLRDEPLDLLYIDSQVMKPDPDTLARLSVFKLNHTDAPNINLRADCCGTVLATENAEFHRPHTMATFNNLRPFLICGFSAIPESGFNVFTADWPGEKRTALAEKDNLLQVPDPRAPVDDEAFARGVSALQIEATLKPEGSISFAELIEGMEMHVVSTFFDEAHSP